MAYPDSPISFTTKNTGDVIQASHVNDLQSELTAVEQGVLNGSGRLNSSNSTLARLSVTNGSTLNTLQSGASTLASLQVSGNSSFATRPIFTPPDAVFVFRDSTYTAASSALSTITWNQQNILTNSSMHSTAANSELLTPQTTGVYAITGQLTLQQPGAASVMAARIIDSSNTVIGYHYAAGVTLAHAIQVHGIKRFDALGGSVKLVFNNVAGGSTNSVSSGVDQSWFAMHKL